MASPAEEDLLTDADESESSGDPSFHPANISSLTKPLSDSVFEAKLRARNKKKRSNPDPEPSERESSQSSESSGDPSFHPANISSLTKPLSDSVFEAKLRALNKKKKSNPEPNETSESASISINSDDSSEIEYHAPLDLEKLKQDAWNKTATVEQFRKRNIVPKHPSNSEDSKSDSHTDNSSRKSAGDRGPIPVVSTFKNDKTSQIRNSDAASGSPVNKKGSLREVRSETPMPINEMKSGALKAPRSKICSPKPTAAPSRNQSMLHSTPIPIRIVSGVPNNCPEVTPVCMIERVEYLTVPRHQVDTKKYVPQFDTFVKPNSVAPMKVTESPTGRKSSVGEKTKGRDAISTPRPVFKPVAATLPPKTVYECFEELSTLADNRSVSLRKTVSSSDTKKSTNETSTVSDTSTSQSKRWDFKRNATRQSGEVFLRKNMEVERSRQGQSEASKSKAKSDVYATSLEESDNATMSKPMPASRKKAPEALTSELESGNVTDISKKSGSISGKKIKTTGTGARTRRLEGEDEVVEKGDEQQEEREKEEEQGLSILIPLEESEEDKRADKGGSLSEVHQNKSDATDPNKSSTYQEWTSSESGENNENLQSSSEEMSSKETDVVPVAATPNISATPRKLKTVKARNKHRARISHRENSSSEEEESRNLKPTIKPHSQKLGEKLSIETMGSNKSALAMTTEIRDGSILSLSSVSSATGKPSLANESLGNSKLKGSIRKRPSLTSIPLPITIRKTAKETSKSVEVPQETKLKQSPSLGKKAESFQRIDAPEIPQVSKRFSALKKPVVSTTMSSHVSQTSEDQMEEEAFKAPAKSTKPDQRTPNFQNPQASHVASDRQSVPHKRSSKSVNLPPPPHEEPLSDISLSIGRSQSPGKYTKTKGTKMQEKSIQKLKYPGSISLEIEQGNSSTKKVESIQHLDAPEAHQVYKRFSSKKPAVSATMSSHVSQTSEEDQMEEEVFKAPAKSTKPAQRTSSSQEIQASHAASDRQSVSRKRSSKSANVPPPPHEETLSDLSLSIGRNESPGKYAKTKGTKMQAKPIQKLKYPETIPLEIKQRNSNPKKAESIQRLDALKVPQVSKRFSSPKKPAVSITTSPHVSQTSEEDQMEEEAFKALAKSTKPAQRTSNSQKIQASHVAHDRQSVSRKRSSKSANLPPPPHEETLSDMSLSIGRSQSPKKYAKTKGTKLQAKSIQKLNDHILKATESPVERSESNVVTSRFRSKRRRGGSTSASSSLVNPSEIYAGFASGMTSYLRDMTCASSVSRAISPLKPKISQKTNTLLSDGEDCRPKDWSQRSALAISPISEIEIDDENKPCTSAAAKAGFNKRNISEENLFSEDDVGIGTSNGRILTEVGNLNSEEEVVGEISNARNIAEVEDMVSDVEEGGTSNGGNSSGNENSASEDDDEEGAAAAVPALSHAELMTLLAEKIQQTDIPGKLVRDENSLKMCTKEDLRRYSLITMGHLMNDEELDFIHKKTAKFCMDFTNKVTEKASLPGGVFTYQDLRKALLEEDLINDNNYEPQMQIRDFFPCDRVEKVRGILIPKKDSTKWDTFLHWQDK